MTAKPLQSMGIAIARPIEQAKKLAALIEQAGGTPILFPLIEITPLKDYSQFEAIISEIETYDWAIFISSNAVQNAMPRLVKQGIPPNLKFAAIGPVTASELQSYGVKDVLIPKDRFDSESLLALPEMTNVAGKKIMIVRGLGGRDVLAETLKTRGAQVTFAECYQRTNPQTNCDLLAQLWADKKLHGIVVTSSEAMRHLLDLAGDADWLRNVTLFVNHARIAELPLQMGLKVKVADKLGDEAMLETISNSYMNNDISQKVICIQYGSEFKLPSQFEKLGIALNTLGQVPLNALRHSAQNDTCGWYIWGGEVLSQDPDFFQTLHVQHLPEHCPEILPFLALAPGWRVLLAPNQTDVWFEEELLNI